MTKLHSKAVLRRAGQLLAGASVAAAAFAFAHAASAQTLTIESWRNDDADVWNTKIIPAFNKKHPDIKVQFKADPPTEYNAALNARLAGGTAGDLKFGDLATFDLRFFVDLNQQPKLTEKLPFLKGSRLRLSIDNVFDAQRRITDANGVVPLNYQPGYIDPLGRYIELEWRKTF